MPVKKTLIEIVQQETMGQLRRNIANEWTNAY